jgi:hypothetical protein
MAIALAVLRLMTNSTLVVCSTGRLAGLSPLRIRPASGVRPHLWLAEHRIRSELWAPFRLHRPRVVCAALGPT